MADIAREETAKSFPERKRKRAVERDNALRKENREDPIEYEHPEKDNPYIGKDGFDAGSGFRPFIPDPKDDDPDNYKKLKPNRHLEGFRVHERLGRTALHMGFHIIPPMETVLPDTVVDSAAKDSETDSEDDEEERWERMRAAYDRHAGDPDGDDTHVLPRAA